MGLLLLLLLPLLVLPLVFALSALGDRGVTPPLAVTGQPSDAGPMTMAGQPPYTGPPITFGAVRGPRVPGPPKCVVIVRDRSGSVVQADPNNQSGAEARAAVDFLSRDPSDEVAIVDFADRAFVTGALPLADGLSALRDAAAASPPVGGGTSFTSAASGVTQAIWRCSSGTHPVVIFTSDGASSRADVETALAQIPDGSSTYLIAYGWASGWEPAAAMWRSFDTVKIVVEPRLQPGTTARAFATVFEDELGHKRVETGP